MGTTASKQESMVQNEGSCKCGKIKIKTYTSPLLVVNCHCSKCRSFTSEPYSSTTLYLKSAVEIEGKELLEFENTSIQCNTIGLSRCRCSICKQPVIDIGRLMFRGFTCPSAKLLGLEPTCNMFYNSGEKGGTMNLKTYYSDFMSTVFAFPILFQALFQWIRYKSTILLGGLCREKKKTP